MAEREITVSLKLDPKGFEQGANVVEGELLTINEQLGKMEDELRNLSKEAGQEVAKKSFDELNATVEKNILSIQELGTAADNYKNIALAAGTTSPLGQEALQRAAEMERRMDGLNREVAQLAEGGRLLNTSMALGTTVLAGWSAFQGVAALVGEDNEELQETFVQLQAAQSALMGVTELKNQLSREGILISSAEAAATKAAAIANKAYALAVGTSTGAMKAFRLAMISTGIGAIVVGIGLLVANWESFTKWIGKSTEALGKLAEYFLPIRAFVEWWTGKTYEQIEAEDELMKQRRQAQAEIDQQHKKRVEQIEQERDAIIQAQDKKITELDREKQLREAAGESSTEITEKILKEELIKAQAVFDATQRIIDSYIDRYERIRQLRGQDMEEFKASMKAQGINLDLLQQQANELQEKNAFNVELIENKITGLRKKQNKQRVKDKKDSLDKELEAEEIFFQESTDSWTEYSQNIKDKNFISFDDIVDDEEFMSEMEIQMEETLGKFDEFVLAIGQAYKKGIDNIPDEMKEMLGKVQEGVAFGLDSIMQINDTLNDIGERRIENIQNRSDHELEILKNNTAAELNNEKLSAHQRAKIEFESAKAEYEIKKKAAQEEDKIARRQFQRNKAIALLEIGINTAQAIVKGIAQFGPPPSPLGIAAIATAGGIGIAQAALVASKKFQGSAGSITPPTFTPPNIDTGDIGNDTGNNTGGGGGDEITTDTDALLNQGPTVVISQVEINKTQNELSNIADISTL